LLFTTDPTIETLFDEIGRLGARDTELQLLQSGGGAAYHLCTRHGSGLSCAVISN
jgi:hypothetical protein